MVFSNQGGSSGGEIALVVRISDLPKDASLDQVIKNHTKSLRSITHINIGGQAFSGWYAPDRHEWTWSYAADRSSGQMVSISTPLSSFETDPAFAQIVASMETIGSPSWRGYALIIGPSRCATAETPISLAYSPVDTSAFSCDKTHVYYKNKAIQGADPDTFAFLSLDGTHEPDDFVTSYEVDKNAIYYLGNKIADDPQVARFITPDFDSNSTYQFLADSDRVFYEGKPLSGADPLTFTILNNDSVDCTSEGYSRDANHIYFDSHLIMGAGTSTFKVLTNGYAADGQNVYYGESATSGDPSTFTPPPCDESGMM